MENATPMLKQYQNLKSNYSGYILFFRLGDFYEMFYDDAKTAAKILDLVLTSRGSQKSAKIPMCGIPYHASDNYISRLIKAGLKVAICEQTENPALAKGLVKREVTRLISSGTFFDANSSDARFLVSFLFEKDSLGLAFTEISSQTIFINQYNDIKKGLNLIAKLNICEYVYPLGQTDTLNQLFKNNLLNRQKANLSPQDDWAFNCAAANKLLAEHFQVKTLEGFGVADKPLGIAAAGALLKYLKEMHKQPLKAISRLSVYTDSDFAFISPAACQGLQLAELFTTINQTQTAFGKRKLANWLYHPLKDKTTILDRQNAISLLANQANLCENLAQIMRNLPDLEKSLTKISSGHKAIRDILNLRNGLAKIPLIQDTLKNIISQSELFKINDILELRTLLETAINPDIPLANWEGKIIRSGFHKDLDELKKLQTNHQEWLRNYQTEEIKRTNINSLKVGYNRVFGYYIEITKTNLNQTPANYIRKQTLANAERFITEELKNFEEKILSAETKIIQHENELLEIIIQQVLANALALSQVIEKLAQLDAIYALAILAQQPGYIKPLINDNDKIEITAGRHPVVEQTLADTFIPNDLLLDTTANHLLVITGPNMSGKSTYIRQTAILVILAQIGSFIPAQEASIGICDKIFTRIGAQDQIFKGQSTFMVEMNETAQILNNLSQKSLVILDEIGRGTSTYDGLSLAWAIAEHLAKLKIRTLFATHFHEMPNLAKNYNGVKNYNVEVKEWNDEIIFLHKIIPGSSDDSYGIYVAKLAGIPQPIIEQAKKILAKLELTQKIDSTLLPNKTETQLSLFNQQINLHWEKLNHEIKNLPIDKMTPLEALNHLQILQNKLKETNGND